MTEASRLRQQVTTLSQTSKFERRQHDIALAPQAQLILYPRVQTRALMNRLRGCSDEQVVSSRSAFACQHKSASVMLLAAACSLLATALRLCDVLCSIRPWTVSIGIRLPLYVSCASHYWISGLGHRISHRKSAMNSAVALYRHPVAEPGQTYCAAGFF